MSSSCLHGKEKYKQAGQPAKAVRLISFFYDSMQYSRCNLTINATTLVRLAAFLLAVHSVSARKTAAGFQPRRPFFFQSTFVVRRGSSKQLPDPLAQRLPAGLPPFCCAGHGTCTAKQPSSFNQDGRFSLFIERKSRQKKERIRIRQKKKRRSFAALRKSGVSFCLPK